MQYRAVIVIRIGVYAPYSLSLFKRIALLDKYVGKIGIDCQIASVAYHDYGIETGLTEYSRHSASEYNACIASSRNFYINAAVVSHHMRQVGMLVPSERTYYLIFTAYRKEQPSFVAFKTAGQLTVGLCRGVIGGR